jgi:hypothetical protein
LVFTRLPHLLNEGCLRECYRSLGKEKACGIAVAVTGDWLKRRVREICQHGSVRGVDACCRVR